MLPPGPPERGMALVVTRDREERRMSTFQHWILKIIYLANYFIKYFTGLFYYLCVCVEGSALRDQKKVSGPLELELQVASCLAWALRTELRSSKKAGPAEPSHQAFLFFPTELFSPQYNFKTHCRVTLPTAKESRQHYSWSL